MSLPPRFSLRAIIRSHGWSRIGPFDTDKTGDTLFLALPDGRARIRQRGRKLLVEGTGDLDSVRACLQPDLDLRPFWRLTDSDPALDWVSKARAGGPLRAPTAFADATMVLATTNCSWALTTRMLRNLILRYGKNGAFPAQRRIARLAPSALRETGWGYRAPYLAALARGPDLEPLRTDRRPTEELRRLLLGLPGFGPYAADCMLRLLGRFEHLALDSWVTRVWQEKFPRRKATESAIRRQLARYREWTGLAFFLMITADWYDRADWKTTTDLTA